MKQNNTAPESVCIVGTMVPEDEFARIQSESKVKAAISPNTMQINLYSSLSQVCEDVHYISYPAVATWPRSRVIFTRKKRMALRSGLPVDQIFMINLPGLKQLTVFLSMLFSLLGWAGKRRNRNCSIIAYADFPEYCLPALWVGRLYKIPVCLFLTELPGYAHYKIGKRTLKDHLIIWAEKNHRALYSKYDGFVLVSAHSSVPVGVGSRPWTVVEGFAEESLCCPQQCGTEAVPTAMYAGSLGVAYNIPMLCDAFRSLKGDYRLLICGDGSYREYVQRASEQDSRIRYLGRLPREEVVRLERRSHLLIHAKDIGDEHSRYAFSTKIMEYMLSGTPVLTTRVDGVPQEYYPHAFVVEGQGQDALAKALEQTLSLPVEHLREKGKQAQQFIMENKSQKIQGGRIMDMLRSIK